MNVARAMRIVLAAIDMTGQQMAHRIGVGGPAVSLWVTGKRTPTLRHIEAFCREARIPIVLFSALACEDMSALDSATALQVLRWLVSDGAATAPACEHSYLAAGVSCVHCTLEGRS